MYILAFEFDAKLMFFSGVRKKKNEILVWQRYYYFFFEVLSLIWCFSSDAWLV